MQGQPARLVWAASGFAALVLGLMLAGAMGRAVGHAMAAGAFYGIIDFNTMWQAGALLRDGGVAVLYDRHLFDAWLQLHDGGRYADESWLYTPPMGLFAAGLSYLPLPFSFWFWRVAMLLASTAILRRAGLGWWVIAAGLLGPAEVYDFTTGQNGTLTAGLLAGALLTAETRPVVSGWLGGCLLIKPQIGILLPAAFLQRRLWRVGLTAAASILLLAASATIMQGGRAWWDFSLLAQPNAGRILAIPFGGVFQRAGFTVFLMARSFGLGLRAAWAVQLLCSLAAMLGVWRLWRAPTGAPVARMALTVCASMLAMPYGFSYDLVSLSIAVAALVPGAKAWEAPVLALLWLWPGFTSVITVTTGFVLLPFAALIGIALSLCRLRRFDRCRGFT